VTGGAGVFAGVEFPVVLPSGGTVLFPARRGAYEIESEGEVLRAAVV